jgi:hypothetical protein
VRRIGNQGLTGEDETATVRDVKAGHAVEEGGLAGAIGTDQTGDHALFNGEINAIDSGQAAEGFGYFSGF